MLTTVENAVPPDRTWTVSTFTTVPAATPPEKTNSTVLVAMESDSSVVPLTDPKTFSRPPPSRDPALRVQSGSRTARSQCLLVSEWLWAVLRQYVILRYYVIVRRQCAAAHFEIANSARLWRSPSHDSRVDRAPKSTNIGPPAEEDVGRVDPTEREKFNYGVLVGRQSFPSELFKCG